MKNRKQSGPKLITSEQKRITDTHKELIFAMSEGRKSDYDSYMMTDTFEVFRLMDLWEKRNKK